MGKSKKPRKRAKTREERAAEAACHAEIGDRIKACLSSSDLNELVASIVRMEGKAQRAGQRSGVEFAFTICMIVMCDKFGFGKVRLERMWGYMKTYIDEISAGRLDYELVAQTLKDDYGIEIDV